MIHVITYATHSHGTFDKLINNEFNIPVQVLGWNTEWRGFNDKFIGVYKYIKTLPADAIVLFVDGFDSVFNKNIDVIEKRFLEMNSKVVFSLDHESRMARHIFGTCIGNNRANTGLYIGYVEYLKPILKKVLQLKCTDDQVKINSVCKDFPYISIDTDNYLFLNIIHGFNKDKLKNTCIVQYPGKTSLQRYIRGFKEYSQYVVFNTILIFYLIIVLFPNHIKYTLPFIFLYMLLFTVYSDKSCIF